MDAGTLKVFQVLGVTRNLLPDHLLGPFTQCICRLFQEVGVERFVVLQSRSGAFYHDDVLALVVTEPVVGQGTAHRAFEVGQARRQVWR